MVPLRSDSTGVLLESSLADPTSLQTLVDFLDYRATHQPNRIAYTAWADHPSKEVSLTYQDLQHRANSIAAQLQAQGATGSRALVIYPYHEALPFIAAFLGCLYAGVVAVTDNPPHSAQNLDKIQARATACQATIALTTQGFLRRIRPHLSRYPVLAALPWVATDTIATDTHAQGRATDLEADTLAFLQYTSGSTGVPKGVQIHHRNLLRNLAMLQQGFGDTPESTIVSWLPAFHDMGLIVGLLYPLYVGFPSVQIPPVAFVQKPLRWLQAISRHQATTSGAPNFAYDLLCQRVQAKQLSGLDLSHWRLAYSGAEAVRAETLDQFSQMFAPCGFARSSFYPCYGMAEATVFISGGQKPAAPLLKPVDAAALEQNQVVPASETSDATRLLVGCGQTWMDTRMAIVDPQTLTRCSANQVGEIWIAGSGLGRGYWQHPQETARTFDAYFADTGEGPFLRTGDLGFIHAGELYITGRLKEMMVFWGRNHYPQNIERTVERCHPALRHNCGAAFAVPVANEDRLVVAYEVERTYRRCFVMDEIVAAVRWAIALEHSIDIYGIVLLRTTTIPKTSSGKIQRRLCRTQYLEGCLETIAQWHAPLDQPSNLTALLHQYLNPLTHLNRFGTMVRGRLKRWVYQGWGR